MKTLFDVVTWLQRSDEREVSMKTICLLEPWSAQAAARVVELDEESRLPVEALAEGYKYFLEASIAREVLDVLRNRSSKVMPEDACRLLIYYAEKDAYPEWVYM